MRLSVSLIQPPIIHLRMFVRAGAIGHAQNIADYNILLYHWRWLEDQCHPQVNHSRCIFDAPLAAPHLRSVALPLYSNLRLSKFTLAGTWWAGITSRSAKAVWTCSISPPDSEIAEFILGRCLREWETETNNIGMVLRIVSTFFTGVYGNQLNDGVSHKLMEHHFHRLITSGWILEKLN